MSLRRPSLKSTVLMLLVASGMLLGVAMIFRGAGAPVEPARAVVPTFGNLMQFPLPGRYIILTEQVILPRPTEASRLPAPPLDLELTECASLDPRIRGKPVTVSEAGWLDWAYKILSRSRGRTFGHVHIERPGNYFLDGSYPREIAEDQKHVHLVLAFARPASPGRMLWLLLGFGGQIVFSARFLIQWLASEKAGRSVVPRAFWHLSLAGGLMILGYAAYTRDPVFIAGYAPNALIYVRNLVLLGREDAGKAAGAASAGPEDRA